MIVCWFVGELESHYSVKEAFAALLEVFFVRPYGPQPVPKVPYAFFIELQSQKSINQRPKHHQLWLRSTTAISSAAATKYNFLCLPNHALR